MEIRYWRRLRGYQRLDVSAKKANSGRRNVKRVKMDPTRKRRFWRIIDQDCAEAKVLEKVVAEEAFNVASRCLRQHDATPSEFSGRRVIVRVRRIWVRVGFGVEGV
ncbi:hypothetical protein ISN45_Aa04g033690 [Arabidopsis thaliana x Arabidopsis arenosa]|uniref:Uncharacterized protein n=1 Tax=Arabidopsis thaliana x Arabidopsis arenosa TaxID=1240361 RepID=A0A8T2ACL5_9BRAS|nr:hypothetical protein ISN45_Aa04g033690 [Arabidopsis thaliana x Arabidopsis arenosa]